ncbi:hypothetical protein ACTQ33_08260 [Candidatus Avoscillospira sp. LCP25S3_F1]|uniref:hypothetical protein n=1 Tax=Candidatus Avoscillospira sp. LCP25S3_F1 TaxID=3438825 RepID=UPI003F931EB2
MTRTAKRTGQWKLWQLILRGMIVPLVLLLAVAAFSGMVAIRQWVPQTGIRYLSYLTAAVFYLLAPLPMIKLIGKYPLPIACGYGILWTALFALFNNAVWPQGGGNEGAVLWIIIACAVFVSGLLGMRLTRR